METYLLKFSACLLVFWLVYVLLLEKQTMHHFKRFYLLGAIALALLIPTLTITEYVEPVVANFETLPMSIPFENSYAQIPQEQPPFLDLATVLWIVYGLGALIFALRFLMNLIKMKRYISKNETIAKTPFIYVLLKAYRIPHSFFKYIFLNKTKYYNNEIPKEVILHEETHAKQLHSLDILIIEVLQIVFWFHPLIYLIKHHIKLNHEFLADEAVLKRGVNTKNYQNILLQFSSSTTHHQLASAINYSSTRHAMRVIKKRFTVMKTQTSKTKIWLSTLLLLPIIAILFYSFAETEYVEREPLETSELLQVKGETQTKEASEKLMQEYRDFIANFNKTKIIRAGKYERAIIIYNELMSDTQRNSVQKYPKQPFPPRSLSKVEPKKPTSEQLEFWKDGKKYAIWIDSKHVPNSELNNYAVTDFVHFIGSKVYKNARSEKFPQPFQFSLFTKEGFQKSYKEADIDNYRKLTANYSKAIKDYIKGPQTDNSELKILYAKLKKMYNQFSEAELKEYNILMPPPAPAQYKKPRNQFKAQQKATPKQIAEYNKLAKHCNSQLENEFPIIKVKEVKRIEYLYGKMSKKQKEDAEPYPDFSKMPPPPPPATGIIEVNGETLFYVAYVPRRYYNKKGYLVDKNGKTLNGNVQVNASDVLPGQYITKVYQNDKVVVEFKDNQPNRKKVSINLPPPPPPAKQQKATPKQMAEYNAWVKRINGSDNKIIKLKDLKKYTQIYTIMSDEQKEVAEAFPKIPPPPPPATKAPQYKNGKKKTLNEIIKETPKNIESGFEMLENGESHYFTIYKSKKTYYNSNGYITDDKGNVLPPPPPLKRIKKGNKEKGGPNTNSNDIFHNSELKKEYIKKFKKYEALRYAKPHFLKKSKEKKQLMSDLWVELRQMYIYDLSKEDKADLELPITPFAPYVKINKDGKSYYKVNSELTEEERNSGIFPRKKPSMFKGLDLLDDTDPIVIPIENYTLEKEELKKEEKGGKRVVFIAISEDGTYTISKDNSYRNFEEVSLKTLETVVAQLSSKEKKNTFILSSNKDHKKFRSKPANAPEYQNDIEVLLIKDGIRFSTMKIKGKYKEYPSYQLVLDNRPSDQLKRHVSKLAELFKKYSISNLTI